MYSILFMKQMSFNEGNSMTLALVYFTSVLSLIL